MLGYLHESNMLNSYNRLNTRLDNRLNVCIQPVGQPVAYRVNEVAYNSDSPARHRQTEYPIRSVCAIWAI